MRSASTLARRSNKARLEATSRPATEAQTRYAAVICRSRAKRIDSQLGLEPTPDEYIAKMVAVFGEVKRVLRDDGTLWLNIGDSYAGSGKWDLRTAS